MSAIQMIKSQQVSEQSIKDVCSDLKLELKPTAKGFEVQFESGQYGKVQFEKNSDEFFNIKYDNMYESNVKKLIDCVILEEIMTQAVGATTGRITSHTACDQYMANKVKELSAEVIFT